MASSVLSGLVQRYLPSVIQWGARKLGNTQLGRGVGNRFNTIKRFVERPQVQQMVNHVMPQKRCPNQEDQYEDQLPPPRKRRPIRKVKFNQRRNKYYAPPKKQQRLPPQMEQDDDQQYFGDMFDQ